MAGSQISLMYFNSTFILSCLFLCSHYKSCTQKKWIHASSNVIFFTSLSPWLHMYLMVEYRYCKVNRLGITVCCRNCRHSVCLSGQISASGTCCFTVYWESCRTGVWSEILPESTNHCKQPEFGIRKPCEQRMHFYCPFILSVFYPFRQILYKCGEVD